MKKLIDSNEYRKALNLFDEQTEISSDFMISLALQACTKLNVRQRVIKIQQQLSSKSLQNPFIHTPLIQFYSKSLNLYLN